MMDPIYLVLYRILKTNLELLNLNWGFAYDVQMPFKKTVEVFFCRMDETANIAVEAQVSVY